MGNLFCNLYNQNCFDVVLFFLNVTKAEKKFFF